MRLPTSSFPLLFVPLPSRTVPTRSARLLGLLPILFVFLSLFLFGCLQGDEKPTRVELRDCEKLAGLQERQCYLRVAAQGRDASVCAEMGGLRDECYGVIANATGNKTLCEYIANPEMQSACVNR